MSILFVLLTFLLLMSISYFFRSREVATVTQAVAAAPPPPRMVKDFGFEVPKSYSFHPGHTWVLDEGRNNARIGMDAFAGNLIGPPERIDVAGLNHWVRQGQKLWTVTKDGKPIEMLSPVEGVVIAINNDVIKDPKLAATDPYKNGWICMVKAPEMDINRKNLLGGTMVGPWMQHSVRRLSAIAAGPMAATAQDGGLPVSGLISKVEPELRATLVKEFFLT